MELLVVTWAVRFALAAGLGAGAVSMASGADVVDSVIRALLAALAFLFVTGFLLDRLEPPEQRLARLRARRAKKRSKSAGDPAAARAVGRSRTA